MITTFVLPFTSSQLSAASLSECLFTHGLAIYPSQLSEVNSFRIGFIGELTDADADQLIAAIGQIVTEIHSGIDQHA